jgi:hypothetical protein
MSALDRFPGAPKGAYVCEEGWLIVGDEAWTEAEWSTRHGRSTVSFGQSKYLNRYTTQTERRLARLRTRRESARRRRAMAS